ncbi:MAG: BamA/TamA family outer membrane protein [Candidatus Aminicenantes bacterium]|nr:BamA/TamA family outer membrane protein [Candidatus Aminicenantes bacterium]
MSRFASGSKVVRAAAVAALALIFALIGAAPAGAGQASATVTSVSVFVDGLPADADFAALVPIAPGLAFSAKSCDAALRQLYRTGLFADIQILRREGTDIRLTVLLERRLTTRAVTFRGGHGVSSRLLSESLFAIRPDAPYTENLRVRAEAELREALRREGYLNGVVISSARRVKDRPAVDVLFEIVLGARFTVSAIGFKGRPIAEPSTLARLIKTKPGKPYNPTVVEADLARLKTAYNDLGYPRAEISLRGRVFHESDNTVSLNFFVVPQERIVIEVRGAKVDQAPLRAIWEQPVFEDWAVERAEARILADLRADGYLFAAIRSRMERTPEEIRVIHEAVPGEKVRLRDVVIEGATHFAPDDLKRALGGTPRLPLGGAAVYDLPSRIIDYYKSQGFPEARAELSFRSADQATDAVLTIVEGPRQTIERVTATGALLFTAEELLTQVTAAAGGAYVSPSVQRDVGRLEAFYANRGVRDTKIVAAVETVAENRHTVEFRIVEGRRLRVERIVVAGSPITQRRLIDRQLRLREGDWAGAEAIQESKRELERLGVFSEIQIEEVPTGPETVDLVINLREGERNLVSLGLGLETKNEPMRLDLAKNVIGPRATAEYTRGNVFGRAAQLSLISQFSEREKRAVVSWEEPFLFGWSMPITLNGWAESEARESYGFDRRGISLSGSRTLASGWISLTTLRWASTTLNSLEIAANEVDRQFFPYSATSVSETFLLDRRDDSFNPERGTFLSGVLEWAYPLFKVESDYVKTFVKGQVYQPLFGRWNLSLTGRAGLAMGRIPIHERFFAGGSNSFRGRSFDRLGPKDIGSDMPVGGKAIVLFNLELRFPLLPSLPALTGAVFYDAGNVFAHRGDFSLAGLENAVGAGLRYRTPLGPIRFDLGWNLNAPAGQARMKIFITIGDVF